MEKVQKINTISLARLVNHPTQVEERHSEDRKLFHVSSLFTLCFRKVHLLWEHGEKEYRTIPLATRIRFDMGEAVEEKMRQRLTDLGVITKQTPEFVDRDFGIVGHADGRLKNGMLLEIKGKDPAIFKLTKRYPLRRDQYQVEIYLWMDQTQEAKLLSFTWGDAPMPLHDHSIRYNIRSVDITKRQVGRFREAQSGGPIPLRICATKEEKRAILCPMRHVCFDLPSDGLGKTIEDHLKEKPTTGA